VNDSTDRAPVTHDKKPHPTPNGSSDKSARSATIAPHNDDQSLDRTDHLTDPGGHAVTAEAASISFVTAP
jgi:hypothetical protein